MPKPDIVDLSSAILKAKPPDIDRMLYVGMARVCREYRKLALAHGDMTVETLERLVQLTKGLVSLKKEPGIQAIIEQHKRTARSQLPQEMANDILGPDDAQCKAQAREESPDVYLDGKKIKFIGE